jgi:hypothetical protein
MSSTNEPRDAIGGHPDPLSSAEGRPDIREGLPSGVRVQVWNRFDGAWASGFRIFASQPSGGYLVRRLSDGSVLPIDFAEDELRLDPVPLPAGAQSSWPPPAVV